jgi:nucleoside-diphosphate-sugar epimerase
MRVLILGGTALIGPHLIRELAAANCTVATVTRTGNNYFGERAFTADRNDKESLTRIIREFAPNRLVDTFPFTTNDAAVFASAIEQSEINCPIIALSSTDVYSAYAKLHGTEMVEYQPCPIDETARLRSDLGVEGVIYDKLNVEKLYLRAFRNISIIRLPALYGWPDTTRVAGYLDPMLNGQHQISIGFARAKWKSSRCLHKNAAFAIALCVLSDELGQHVYNVAETSAHSNIEWCREIAKVCGWSGKIVEVPEEHKVDFQQDFYVSSERIRRERGYYEKYSMAEGLADTVAFHAYQRMGKQYTKYY